MTKRPSQIIKQWKRIRSRRRFESLLSREGWKRVGFGLDAVVYGIKEADFVVKLSDGVPTRRFKEPSLERFRLGHVYVSPRRKFSIQRKVATRTSSSRYRAWKVINEAVEPEIDLLDYDIHQDNVGWLDGKPVIFDYS